MTEKWTHERFEKCLQDLFRVAVEGRTVELRLVQVDVAAGGEGPQRTPFSLVLVGPREPVLSQRLYSIDHARLSVGEIFLVPIGVDDEGVRYEAVFN